jgi:hypothetical protein
MKKIITAIKSFFHKEVDDILKPLNAAIAGVEAFEKKTVAKLAATKKYVAWAETEVEKARRVGDRLRDLVK